MLKLPEDKGEALELAGLAIEGLNSIATVVTPAKAENAAGVVTLIRVVLATLQEGFDGTITADRVREEMSKLTTSLGANDSAADNALNEKKD